MVICSSIFIYYVTMFSNHQPAAAADFRGWNSTADRIVFIGNPGVGKSSLGNNLLQEVKFKSGINIGKGLTWKMDCFEAPNGVSVCDTPGLDDPDPELLKQAAKEITKALRQKGSIQIIFVMKLNDGRIVPSQTATLQKTLDAIQQPIDFGIIINQVAPEVMKELEKIEKRI